MRAYWAWLDFASVDAWARDAVQLGVAIAEPGVHLAVVTSGPPHMTHDTGRRISERRGVPFVMDMRDPWRHVERLSEATASPVWLRLAERYESRAVARAALVIANTPVSRHNLQMAYPNRSEDIITVMNGADDDVLPRATPDRTFRDCACGHGVSRSRSARALSRRGGG